MIGGARVILVLTTLGLAAALAAALRHEPNAIRPEAEAAPAAAEARAVAPMDPAATAGLVARSPFAPDRSAYARAAPAAPPPPPPPTVRLVAIYAVGGEPRATLRIDGEDVSVGVGDETEIGTVAAIETEAVVIEGDETRRLGLFD